MYFGWQSSVGEMKESIILVIRREHVLSWKDWFPCLAKASFLKQSPPFYLPVQRSLYYFKLQVTLDKIRNTLLVSFPIRESSAGSYTTRGERVAVATHLAAEFDDDLDLTSNHI